MKRWDKGKSLHKYSYTLQDIAHVRGVTIHAVRQSIKRGTLNPEDLVSVARYILKGSIPGERNEPKGNPEKEASKNKSEGRLTEG